MTVVGHVAALWRYQVKSMAGEELDAVEVSWHGLAGDRRWAFIRAGQVRSGFPWLTIRERPELAHYRPRFAEPDRPNASRTLVRTPGGSELDVADPALAAELGPGVRVIKQDRGVFDTMPLSLLSTQTLAGLGRLVGADLVAGRFRPNLLVDAAAGEFPEDSWVGRVLRIGALRMRVDQRDQRCVMVTIDPVTLARNPAILRAIARNRDARVGVYGTTVEPGRVTVGDPVRARTLNLPGAGAGGGARQPGRDQGPRADYLYRFYSLNPSRLDRVRNMPADPADLLRQRGYRVTGQRLAVLRAVSGDPHVTADAVAETVRAELGAISIQAVYDVLGVLVDVGLVRRIQPAGSPARFEARVSDNHHHVICRVCGRTADVDCAVGSAPCLTAVDDMGYEIDEAEVIYWGRCAECQSQTRR